MEAGARTGAGVAVTPWESVGDDAVPAYRAQLAGHTIGETFGRAAGFLRLAAADAAPFTGASAHVIC